MIIWTAARNSSYGDSVDSQCPGRHGQAVVTLRLLCAIVESPRRHKHVPFVNIAFLRSRSIKRRQWKHQLDYYGVVFAHLATGCGIEAKDPSGLDSDQWIPHSRCCENPVRAKAFAGFSCHLAAGFTDLNAALRVFCYRCKASEKLFRNTCQIIWVLHIWPDNYWIIGLSIPVDKLVCRPCRLVWTFGHPNIKSFAKHHTPSIHAKHCLWISVGPRAAVRKHIKEQIKWTVKLHYYWSKLVIKHYTMDCHTIIIPAHQNPISIQVTFTTVY